MTDQSNDKSDEFKKPESSERREALVKLGKYAAYTAPAMLVTTNAKRAFAQAAPGTPVTSTTTMAPTTIPPTSTSSG